MLLVAMDRPLTTFHTTTYHPSVALKSDKEYNTKRDNESVSPDTTSRHRSNDPGKPKEGIMVTAPPTTVVYHHGQRLRIVDGPLAGKSAVVIRHDPDPRALFPIEARTGRAGTITNLFATNEVAI